MGDLMGQRKRRRHEKKKSLLLKRVCHKMAEIS
jgi:hypothetical protein